MKSECSEHQKRISAFILGDLAEEEKRGLEAHLAACSCCRSELESYERTIQQMSAAGEQDIPRHFFVYPEEKTSGPWQLFRLMHPGWQAAVATAAALFLLLGIAAFSRLQIRSDSGGWAISFGRNDIDINSLKKEIIQAAERRDRESAIAWMQQIRTEIARSETNLTELQRIQLGSALARMDSRTAGRIASSEGHTRDDAQKLVSDLYRQIAQQRAQDLELINLRFDSTDEANAIKSRQTNEILGTLSQVADLSLQWIGERK